MVTGPSERKTGIGSEFSTRGRGLQQLAGHTMITAPGPPRPTEGLSLGPAPGGCILRQAPAGRAGAQGDAGTVQLRPSESEPGPGSGPRPGAGPWALGHVRAAGRQARRGLCAGCAVDAQCPHLLRLLPAREDICCVCRYPPGTGGYLLRVAAVCCGYAGCTSVKEGCQGDWPAFSRGAVRAGRTRSARIDSQAQRILRACGTALQRLRDCVNSQWLRKCK